MIKRLFILLIIFTISFLFNLSYAETYESIGILNKTDFIQKFYKDFNYIPESNGDLYFTPPDIHLLSNTLPLGMPIEIKNYNQTPRYSIETLEVFSEIVDLNDIKGYSKLFRESDARMEVYPKINRMIILINGHPYLQVNAFCGPKFSYSKILNIQKDGDIEWDSNYQNPTSHGKFSILDKTSKFVSSLSPYTTTVPFSSLISKEDRNWQFEDKDKVYALPEKIAQDLEKTANGRKYDYYDISVDPSQNVKSARWAGNEFGKYLILFGNDKVDNNSKLAHTPGKSLYDQIILVKNLAQMLTAPGPDDWDSFITSNKDFNSYKDIHTFVESQGTAEATTLDHLQCVYYKFFNNLELKDGEKNLIDQRLIDAFNQLNGRDFNIRNKEQEETLSLYNFLRDKSLDLQKKAYWYKAVKNNWELFKAIRIKLRKDFETLNIFSPAEQQATIEDWLNKRLEFKLIPQPKSKEVSFYSFFKKDDEISLLTQEQKEYMKNFLQKATTAEIESLILYSGSAINNYNFGIFLNEMLGNLYKSHGCLHVSPRDSHLLYSILPIGTKMAVYKYSVSPSSAEIGSTPYLANLINFKDDLEELKKKFETSELSIEVYPSSGDWIINLDKKPFCKLSVKGGPKDKMNRVDSWDPKGNPIFEDMLAYPTTPGTFYIFKKTEHYLSKLYKDTTAIPMGGIIKKDKDKWVYQNNKGNWVPAPLIIQQDLSLQPKDQDYSYYDIVYDNEKNPVQVKWGSNDFGKFAMLISENKKTPSPELIHTSGELIMEQRKLVSNLIEALSAPDDDVDRCIKYNADFGAYKVCYDFIKDPMNISLPEKTISGSYKLYFDLGLTKDEKKAVSPYAFIANKITKKQGKLTKYEQDLLIKAGLAKMKKNKLIIDMQKIAGIQFFTYQYVVAIEKSAHHYAVLKKYWPELTNLRQAMLKDFNKFIINNPLIFKKFIGELMLRRIDLQKISQQEVIDLLSGLL